MPRRDDIDTILILGSGPIVIGQACEFDYSGAQACKVLRREGYRVVLVNSNPATIMTDPEFADATYIEPLTPAFVEKVIARERRQRPDDKLVVLPTLGGQTALNVAVGLAQAGALERHDIELIGAGLESIDLAEDRGAFNAAMAEIGLEQARAGRVTVGPDHAPEAMAAALAQAHRLAEQFGYPLLVRASYTLGGSGSGIVEDPGTFEQMVRDGLEASPIGEVQIDESLLGWKEYELEVMRDGRDNCVVICTIENVDPMGVHTGDSITVAPAQTLSDAEYQLMRDAAFAVMRKVGVATGGSNVQFAIDPTTGRMVVIEMNPRVSRSSALASKATGFPIAKIAALLAVGYTLDEIPNDITSGQTLAAFEPSIDYVVTKIPRWAFEKFPGADIRLGTQMKSVGEVMAIGRTFKESLGKALRSLENGTIGLTGRGGEAGHGPSQTPQQLARAVHNPTAHRIHDVDAALTRGWSPEQVAALSGYDVWFVDQILQIIEVRRQLRGCELLDNVPDDLLRRAKRMGMADALIALVTGATEDEVRSRRHHMGLRPVYKTVDTCAAEFAADTPYYYSTYEEENEIRPAYKPRAIILGSGPNRIGQGIEFDYCCVHAVMSLREAGYETVMINCNPETVSTDYDTADRLYFEPLTLEDVLEVFYAEDTVDARLGAPQGAQGLAGALPPKAHGVAGALVQFGGQTPLKIARALEAAGVPIMGTKPAAIDLAEDRGRFSAILTRLGIAQPPGDIARNLDEALAIASQIGFPVLVRPSYVLGGRAMEIVYTPEQMQTWLDTNAGEGEVLVDRFFENAIEVDVDAVFDGTEVFIGGIMEHIEEAGIHSGDSACVVPPFTLGRAQQQQMKDHTRDIAEALGTIGLINIQFAIRDTEIVVIEANPRASRTIPFISKATGVPLAKVAARVMAGAKLVELADDLLRGGLDAVDRPVLPFNAVKEAVLPFNRFPGVDTRLGPEMRSTGEVMGIDADFGVAFAKSQAGTGAMVLPLQGRVFCSLANRDKRAMVFPVKRLAEMGFAILATVGTADTLRRAGVQTEVVGKFSEGGRSVVDLIEASEVDLILNTPTGIGARADGYEIRTAAVSHGIPCITTLAGILAAIQGIEALRRDGGDVTPLQEYHLLLG